MNIEEIRKVLGAKDIDIVYIGKNKMNSKDIHLMYHYVLTINEQEFDYYEGLGHDLLTAENKENKIINAISCLVRDYNCIEDSDNIDNFMLDYGYEDYETAEEIWYSILDNNSRLDKVFTLEERVILEEQTADL